MTLKLTVIGLVKNMLIYLVVCKINRMLYNHKNYLINLNKVTQLF